MSFLFARWALAIAILTLATSVWGAPALFPLKNEARQVVAQVDPQNYFKQGALALAGMRLETDPLKLAAVASSTLAYLDKHAQDDSEAVTPGILAGLGVTLPQVKATLAFIVQTVAEDQASKRPFRISQPAFLEQHFDFFNWQSDRAAAASHKVKVSDSRIRLTKYVVFEAAGSNIRTSNYNCALYALPQDEVALSADQAEKQKSKLLRYRYTKQEVVAGALAKHHVSPLVWLNRQGLEDALMQGSLMVHMPDGTNRMFNVHRNNGIGYDRKIKDPRLQKRYWYFKEVAGIQGYGKDDKIIVQPAVTVAGDVFNLGLGKLVALRYPLHGKTVMRLAILADTGGAFIPNLYQLDYLAGVFSSRESFRKGVQDLPEYALASVLVLKD
jgi:membrane-bound lytic murein transglycosylase